MAPVVVLTDEPVADIGNSAVVVLACTFALDYAGMQHSGDADDTCLDSSGNCSMDVPCQRRWAVGIVVAEELEQAYRQRAALAAGVVVVAAAVAVDLFHKKKTQLLLSP